MPERRDSDTGPPATAARSRPRASKAGHDGQLSGPLRQFLATESGSAALLAGPRCSRWRGPTRPGRAATAGCSRPSSRCRSATQLRIFLLTITVIDDLVAVTVIGLVYSEPIRPGWLTAGIVPLLVPGLFGRLGTWRLAPYLAATALLWFTLLQAGLHGAIAGMLAGLAIGAHLPRRASVESAANRFQAFRQPSMATVGRSASTAPGTP